MTAKISPQPWLQFIDASGNPYSGGTLNTYAAGTPTPLATYNSVSGGVANPTSIPLNTAGIPSAAGVPIQVCLLDGNAYKFEIWSGGTTPALVASYDDLRGVNDFTAANIAEWYTPSPAIVPTYVSGTSFSIAAANSSFSEGRRVKLTTNAAAVYTGTIVSNSGSSPSTIVINPESGDTTPIGNTAYASVEYGILSGVNSLPAIPKSYLPKGMTAYTQAAGTSDTTLATTSFVTTAANATLDNGVNDFRLSLTTGVPVTSSDVTATSKLYLTPYNGNRIAMYSGSAWSIITSSQVSITFAGAGAGTSLNSTTLPFDIFVVNTAGTLSLESQAWASANARANALARQDGVLTKFGDTTKRYVGTVCPAVAANPTVNKMDDSVANRGIWNYYNQVNRNMKYIVATASWTYNVVAWRTCNALTTYRINFVNGGDGEASGNSGDSVSIKSSLTSGSANGNSAMLGIGFNSTTTPTSLTAGMGSSVVAGANGATVSLDEIPLLGINYAQMLEYCNTANTQTFYGTSGGTLSGIVGMIRG